MCNKCRNYQVEKKVYSEEEQQCCVVDDELAKKLACLWKEAFPDAAILPVIGFPSNNGGQVVISHTAGLKNQTTINGLPVKSILTNHALFTTECSQGKYVNLYEIILPDIPGCNGEDSSSAIYVKLLAKYGLTVDGDHYHWKGAIHLPEQANENAIHHSAIDVHPIYFTKATIKALKKILAVIKARSSSA